MVMDDQQRFGTADKTRLVVRGGRVPPDHASRATALPGADYGDVFTLSCPGAARWTAEAWARAMFGDSPDLVERLIWQGLLHLHLDRTLSPDLVAGWPVVERTDDHVTLETRSWFLTGQLVISTSAASVSLGTFVRYDRRAAGSVWLPLPAIHRRLMPGLFLDAYRKLQAR